MEIIRHYACSSNDELCNFLNQNEISFLQDVLSVSSSRIYFDVSENHPCFSDLLKFKLDDCVISKRARYSKRELETAKWLTCTPTTAKINLVNQEKTFKVYEEYDTGKSRHRILSGMPFYVSKPIAHNAKQHFFTSHEATNQLFCTEHAKLLLQDINLSISFEPVLHGKTELPIGNLHAVHIPYTLPMEALELSNSEDIFICPVCGIQTYLPPLTLQVKEEYLSNIPNICRTEAIFGWGGNYAAPIIIISHEVYSVFAKNNLLRGLEIEPLCLV